MCSEIVLGFFLHAFLCLNPHCSHAKILKIYPLCEAIHNFINLKVTYFELQEFAHKIPYIVGFSAFIMESLHNSYFLEALTISDIML